MHTCREQLQLVYDYVEGRLSMEMRRSLEQHLADCPPCLTFIKTYRRTVSLCCDLRTDDIPQELKDKLRTFLATRVKRA